MKIKGSCYCGSVEFDAISLTPYPYMRCYCSFCRKTSGSGGFGINILADAKSLSISGEENICTHNGQEHDPDTDELNWNENQRCFCGQCGSPLWYADPRWPDHIYPYASAIYTPLPKPPEIVHIMLDFAADWVDVPQGEGHRHFARYADEGMIEWHERHGLLED